MWSGQRPLYSVGAFPATNIQASSANPLEGIVKKIVISLVVTLGLLLPSAATAQAPSQELLNELAADVYVCGYPMVLMETTRRLFTNVPAAEGPYAPMNQFAHIREFPDPTFRQVVRPNADTFYSNLWFDVTGEPLIISVPGAHGRYYMLPMLDFWTEVFASPGTRTSGTQAADFAIVGPEWEGDLPEGVEPIRSPTGIGWIIGRTRVDGPADASVVHQFQEGMKATPLSRWGEDYDPPADVPIVEGLTPAAEPPVVVARMDAETFFELFARLLKQNPPHEMDWNLVIQMRQLGIVPGEEFDYSEAPAAVRQALEQGMTRGLNRLANHKAGEIANGWDIARQMMGSYGTAYTQRAFVALIGLGANLPEDAVYPMSAADADRKPYHGRHSYVLHFEADELPPVHGFWSLAMYDGDGYFVANPQDRYSIGDRDELQYNEDGSLDILLQHESPGPDAESNWLPAPAEDFNLIMRLYWPEPTLLTGDWDPPPVRSSNYVGSRLTPK